MQNSTCHYRTSVYSQEQDTNSLLVATVTLNDLLSVPSALVATHSYRAASVVRTFSKVRAPPGIIVTREYLGCSRSFLNHVTSGCGNPLARQTNWRVSPIATVSIDGVEVVMEGGREGAPLANRRSSTIRRAESSTAPGLPQILQV